MLRQFVELMRNPLEWTSSVKSNLLLLMAGVVALKTMGFGLWLLGADAAADVVNQSAVPGQLAVLGMNALIAFLLMVVVTMAKKQCGEKLWFEYLATHYYGFTLCLFGYQVGPTTLPAGVVLVGAPVVGFILFNRHAVFSAFFFSIVVLMSMIWLSAEGVLEFTPALNEQIAADGRPDAALILGLLLIAAPHCLVLTVLAAIALGRWRQREEEVRVLSCTDPLTGLLNRRSIFEYLAKQREHSATQSVPLAVIMVDLDHFKQINDTWGHPAGDLVIRAAAEVLRCSTREHDMIGRVGGEEFLVVLPGVDTNAARQIGERCLRRLSDLEVELPAGKSLAVSGSLGLFCNEKDLRADVEDLVHRADQALYSAKRGGRRRLVIATSARPDAVVIPA